MNPQEIAEMRDILEDEQRQRMLLPYSSDPQLPIVEPWTQFSDSGIYLGRAVAKTLTTAPAPATQPDTPAAKG